MAKFFAVFLLAATCMLAASAAKADSLCHAVADEVARKGARATVRDLAHRTNGDWDRFIGRVGAGHQECIQAAVTIRPGTDAGTAEDIIYALSQALQHNPEAVLTIVGGSDIDQARVCTDRAIEPTDEQHRRFVQRAIAAVSRVRVPTLAAKRDACLASLTNE